MSDSDVMKVLAKALVSTGLLMVAGAYTLPHPTPLLTVQWASWVCLLSGLYYIICFACRQCDSRRGTGARLLPLVRGSPVMLQPMYVDLPQAPPSDYVDEPARASLLEMSAASVYTYVYGWGLLIFVCLYCITGLHEASSCWWVVGMLVLAFDDLIARRVARAWVVTLGVLIYVSIVSLWWAVSGSRAVDDSILVIFIGNILPVLSPFIFFSLRSTVRAVSRDVRVLLEVAFPFMLIIAISVLLCTMEPRFETRKFNPDSSGRAAASGRLRLLAKSKTTGFSLGKLASVEVHRLNATGPPQETLAPFETSFKSFLNNSNETAPHQGSGSSYAWQAAHVLITDNLPIVGSYLDSLPVGAIERYFVLLATPLIAFYTITLLTDCVVRGYVTEFICSFVLALATKHAVVAGASIESQLSLGAAGTCFVFVILLRRSL